DDFTDDVPRRFGAQRGAACRARTGVVHWHSTARELASRSSRYGPTSRHVRDARAAAGGRAQFPGIERTRPERRATRARGVEARIWCRANGRSSGRVGGFIRGAGVVLAEGSHRHLGALVRCRTASGSSRRATRCERTPAATYFPIARTSNRTPRVSPVTLL